MSYKARTSLRVWREGIWRYRLTTVGVLLSTAGAATAFNNPPKIVSAVAAGAGLLVAGLEIRANRRRAAVLEFRPRTDDFQDVARGLAARGRIVRTAAEVGVVLRAETDFLLAEPVDAEVDTGDFVLHRQMKQYSFEFIARQARKRAMHNDPVLGLASNLPTGPGAGPVRLHRTMYFDFICSNILAQNDVHESDRDVSLLAGRRLFVDRHGELRTFAESRLANTVGVSTLAFTGDGALALVQQTWESVGSPGLTAPSGSGALEPQDLPTDDFVRPTLRDVLLRGAEREMQEECNVKPEETLSSCLIGHARWISRGAMPEFCAVTLLDLTSAELLERYVRRPERAFVRVVRTVRLAPAGTWDPADPLAMLPEAEREHSSWPLAFNLSCLAERMADEAWPMRKQLLELLGR